MFMLIALVFISVIVGAIIIFVCLEENRIEYAVVTFLLMALTIGGLLHAQYITHPPYKYSEISVRDCKKYSRECVVNPFSFTECYTTNIVKICKQTTTPIRK